MSLLVLGSVALDSIQTPFAQVERVIGGSASYAARAASFFSPVKLVSAVGGDWPAENSALLERLGVDLSALEVRPKEKTLYWSARYFEDMDMRETLVIEPNVMGNEYIPHVPEEFTDTKVALLANISPTVQLAMLDRLRQPILTVADTIDFYINTQRDALDRLLPRLVGLKVNESEVRLLAGEDNLVRAARKVLQHGLKFILVTLGKSGVMFLSDDQLYLLPAWPEEALVDPTGAGDSFIGAFMGYLAGLPGACSLSTETLLSPQNIKNGLLHATAVASFTVEGMAFNRIMSVTAGEITSRVNAFRKMVAF